MLPARPYDRHEVPIYICHCEGGSKIRPWQSKKCLHTPHQSAFGCQLKVNCREAAREAALGLPLRGEALWVHSKIPIRREATPQLFTIHYSRLPNKKRPRRVFFCYSSSCSRKRCSMAAASARVAVFLGLRLLALPSMILA